MNPNLYVQKPITSTNIAIDTSKAIFTDLDMNKIWKLSDAFDDVISKESKVEVDYKHVSIKLSTKSNQTLKTNIVYFSLYIDREYGYPSIIAFSTSDGWSQTFNYGGLSVGILNVETKQFIFNKIIDISELTITMTSNSNKFKISEIQTGLGFNYKNVVSPDSKDIKLFGKNWKLKEGEGINNLTLTTNRLHDCFEYEFKGSSFPLWAIKLLLVYLMFM